MIIICKLPLPSKRCSKEVLPAVLGPLIIILDKGFINYKVEFYKIIVNILYI